MIKTIKLHGKAQCWTACSAGILYSVSLESPQRLRSKQPFIKEQTQTPLPLSFSITHSRTHTCAQTHTHTRRMCHLIIMRRKILADGEHAEGCNYDLFQRSHAQWHCLHFHPEREKHSERLMRTMPFIAIKDNNSRQENCFNCFSAQEQNGIDGGRGLKWGWQWHASYILEWWFGGRMVYVCVLDGVCSVCIWREKMLVCACCTICVVVKSVCVCVSCTL